MTPLMLIEYLKQGKWAVVQTTSRRLFLIDINAVKEEEQKSFCGIPIKPPEVFLGGEKIEDWVEIPQGYVKKSVSDKKYWAAFYVVHRYRKYWKRGAALALNQMTADDFKQKPFHKIIETVERLSGVGKITL